MLRTTCKQILSNFLRYFSAKAYAILLSKEMLQFASLLHWTKQNVFLNKFCLNVFFPSCFGFRSQTVVVSDTWVLFCCFYLYGGEDFKQIKCVIVELWNLMMEMHTFWTSEWIPSDLWTCLILSFLLFVWACWSW